MRCVLLSWIAAATAAAGAGAGARCASWRLSSGLIVIFLFLDDCGFSEHFGEECKKKILDSAFLLNLRLARKFG